jgi:hypothetical protein
MEFATEQVEAGRSMEIKVVFDNFESRSIAVSSSSRSIFGWIVVRTAASPEEGIEAPIFASAYTAEAPGFSHALLRIAGPRMEASTLAVSVTLEKNCGPN